MSEADGLEAFGQIKTLEEWAGDRRCAVSGGTLARRVAEGWDFEFALVTVERTGAGEAYEYADLASALLAVPARGAARPATLGDRMGQVRAAAVDCASAPEIAGLLRVTPERVRQVIAAMPDADDIRKTIEANRLQRAAQQASARALRQAAERAAVRARPRREPFTPDPGELAELRGLVPVAARLRGGFAADSPVRLAAVRRDEIVSGWKSRGASHQQIAQLAGVTAPAVVIWIDPERQRSRRQGPRNRRSPQHLPPNPTGRG